MHINLYPGIPFPTNASFILLHMVCGGVITPHRKGLSLSNTETEHSAGDGKVCVYIIIKVKVSIC